GALADFGCHYMDLPHWALGLRVPSSAEVVDGPPVHPESTPPWLIIRYEYPAKGGQPLKLTWYHGGKHPEPPILSKELGEKWSGGGVWLISSKGGLLSDYTNHILLPEEDLAGFVPPKPTIPVSNSY